MQTSRTPFLFSREHAAGGACSFPVPFAAAKGTIGAAAAVDTAVAHAATSAVATMATTARV